MIKLGLNLIIRLLNDKYKFTIEQSKFPNVIEFFSKHPVFYHHYDVNHENGLDVLNDNRRLEKKPALYYCITDGTIIGACNEWYEVLNKYYKTISNGKTT